MFEVEYPETGQYDGKVHSITIEKAFEVNDGGNKYILVYGQEKGRIIPLVLQYMEDIKEYVYIPCSKMELLKIASPILDREEITEELIEKLRGKRIRTVLDSDIEKIVKVNNEIGDNQNIGSFTDMYSKEEKSSNNLKDVDEILEVNKRKALILFDEFVGNNTNKYHKNNVEINILNLINNLLKTIQEIDYTVFTEDDLIDLGSLLAKLNYGRVNQLSIKDFQLLIDNGYELCNKLSLKKESVKK